MIFFQMNIKNDNFSFYYILFLAHVSKFLEMEKVKSFFQMENTWIESTC
jgi:hypothetical protein